MRRLICFYCAIAFFPAACAFQAAENKPPQRDVAAQAQQEPLKPRDDVAGLPNFAKVSEVLYRGAQPTAEGFAQLKKMGIKTIINLRSLHSDRSKLEGTGLQYVHITAEAWNPEEEDVLKFLKIALNPAHQPVFVHCKCGADRTGMMVAIYRMLEQGWNLEKVFKEMDNFGRHPVFSEINDYLKKLDPKTLPGKLEQTPEPKIDVIK
jgi:protein tyrosine/serine phosphatase